MQNRGLWGFIRHPLKTIWTMTYGEGDWLVQYGPGKLALAVLLFPLALLFQFVLFLIFTWTVTRNGRSFLAGIPAILVVCGMITAFFVFRFFKENFRNRYHGAYQLSMRDGDLDEATLWCSKARSLDPVDPRLKFAAASLFADQHKDEPAVVFPKMKSLAPLKTETDEDEEGDEEEPVILEAHVWCADYYLRLDKENTQEVRFDLAKQHLEKVIEGLKSQETEVLLLQDERGQRSNEVVRAKTFFVQAHQMLGRIYEFEGKVVKAIEHYENAATMDPMMYPRILNLILEHYGKDSKEFTSAKKNAQKSIQDYVVDNRFTNNYRIWVALIRCFVIANEYALADQQIDRARQMVTDNRVSVALLKLKSEVYVHAVDNFKYLGTEEDKFNRKIQLITTALRNYPKNRGAISKMLEQLEPPKGPLTDKQISLLQDYSLHKKSPFVAHLLLGLDAAFRSMNSVENSLKSDAILQWKLAISQNSSSKDILAETCLFMSARKKGQAITLFELLDSQDDLMRYTGEKDKKEDEAKKKEDEAKKKQKEPFAEKPEENEIVLTQEQIESTKKAIGVLHLAITMDPGEVAYLETRGILHLRLKDYVSAYDDLVTAHELSPQSPRALRGAMYCAEKLGKTDEYEKYKAKFDKMIDEFKRRQEILRSTL